MSVWKEPLDEALSIGDLETAKQIVKDARRGMSSAKWEDELKNLKQHIKSKQPIKGLTGSAVSRSEFMRWAKDNTTPYERERCDDWMKPTAAALRIGLDIEFKTPDLEDVMKFRQDIKLKREPTVYQPSE